MNTNSLLNRLNNENADGLINELEKEQELKRRKKFIQLILGSPSELKEHIFFTMINVNDTPDLENKPHKIVYGEYAVVFSILVEKASNGVFSYPIDNTLADKLHLTSEELYKKSLENTKIIFPCKTDKKISPFDNKSAICIISNDIETLGAAAILYNDILKEAADKIGESIWLIPSSENEWMAVPESAASYIDIKMFIMLADVLEDGLLGSEPLFYDAKKNIISRGDEHA